MSSRVPFNSLLWRRYLRYSLPLILSIGALTWVWFDRYHPRTIDGTTYYGYRNFPPQSKQDPADKTLFELEKTIDSRPLNTIYPNEEVARFSESVFLLLKSGADVIYERLPGHFNSSFVFFPSYQVISEFDSTVLGVDVIDVIKYIPEQYLEKDALDAYRKRKEADTLMYNWRKLPLKGENNRGGGWEIDKYKNIPGFAHAYIHHPHYDWYYMMDADTLTYPLTLYEAAKNVDPSEPHLMGRDVGPHHFTHGGSGMLASKGLLELLYGNTPESVEEALSTGAGIIEKDCCGDQAFCKLAFTKVPEIWKDWEGYDDAHLFQGAHPHETKANFDYWCQSVGTFHHMEPYEFDLLTDWYVNKITAKTSDQSPTHYDFFHDFILPYMAEELPMWKLHFKIEFGFLKYTENWLDDSEGEAATKDTCKKACADRETCYCWSFAGPGNCELLHYGVVPPVKMEPYMNDYKKEFENELVSGYMLDRIRQRRAAAPCDPYNDPNVPDEEEGRCLRESFDYYEYRNKYSIIE